MFVTFNNLDEVYKYLEEQAESILWWVQMEVYDIVQKFVDDYYKEYSPDFYERTYQLYESLIRSDIKKIGNTYIAEVYFDKSKLDYSMKRFKYWIGLDGLYYNPFNPASRSTDYWFNNKGYSNDKTLSTAMVGSKPHGGRADGTAIWIESLKEIHKMFVPFCIKELKSRGIPVRAIY